VPDPAVVTPVLEVLHGHLAAGAHVVIHCRNGIGRSSLLAAALLLREGLDPSQAWDCIATARGLASRTSFGPTRADLIGDQPEYARDRQSELNSVYKRRVLAQSWLH
jgi:hypothetical protein